MDITSDTPTKEEPKVEKKIISPEKEQFLKIASDLEDKKILLLEGSYVKRNTSFHEKIKKFNLVDRTVSVEALVKQPDGRRIDFICQTYSFEEFREYIKMLLKNQDTWEFISEADFLNVKKEFFDMIDEVY
jgi:hypothetical protein